MSETEGERSRSRRKRGNGRQGHRAPDAPGGGEEAEGRQSRAEGRWLRRPRHGRSEDLRADKAVLCDQCPSVVVKDRATGAPWEGRTVASLTRWPLCPLAISEPALMKSQNSFGLEAWSHSAGGDAGYL
uniref:Uncharacterized protein n=1 Tax=Rousettus aegyptiacus TaxID=9407 RepID=A0A7J8HRN6_ROUAE|nr:hypothetical protein HJG63_011117 [Rousettus aegyptiacus]